MLSSKIHGFFQYVTDPLIFSKRVRGEMSFQRGKTIWPEQEIRQTSNSVRFIFGGGAVVVYRGG